MSPLPTITERVPSSEDQQFLADRMYEHNAAKIGQDDGRLFSLWMHTDTGEIAAGLSGWIWAGACEIQYLWVHPAFRKHAYGSALLEAAEEKALAGGCQVIFLRSYSFQAPVFYQNHGYDLAWRLKDFPPGYEDCFLVKRLAGPGD